MNMRSANPSPRSLPQMPREGGFAPGDPAGALHGPARAHSPRWRSLAVMGPGAAPAAMAWVEEVFGCAVWGAAAGRTGVRAGWLCEGSWGHAGFSDLAALHMRRGGAAAPCLHAGMVFLWFIESGALSVELDEGKTVRHGAGAVLLSDGAQPLRARWPQARVHHLGLSRRWLEEAVGLEALVALQGLMPLGHLGLTSFLTAQLQLLRKQGPEMAAAELEESLSLVFGTARSLLRLALPCRREALPSLPLPPEDAEGAQRLAAVHRFIDKNLHRHDLNAQQIALGVNSSRAQLYRLFEAQPLSVHGTLREARLRKSLEYLRQCGDGVLSIGAIAYACGFSDQSVFSKQFKQRFSVTPSALRSALGAGRLAVPGASFFSP